MNEDSNDILERLKHPEREAERRRPARNLFLRNLLNGIFMLMAATAMIGLVVTWHSPEQPVWCYVLGLLAVLVKMVEAMLRMPGLLHAPQAGRRVAEERRGGASLPDTGGTDKQDGHSAGPAEKKD